MRSIAASSWLVLVSPYGRALEYHSMNDMTSALTALLAGSYATFQVRLRLS